MGRSRHAAETTPGQQRVSILVFFRSGQGLNQSLSEAVLTFNTAPMHQIIFMICDGGGNECDQAVLREYEGHNTESHLHKKIL